MTPLHSDALIFFGATGDLAYKKIFPALQAMVKRLCFAREDYVEEAWRIVDPVLKAGTPVYEYEPNSWGPSEVEQKVSPGGGWQNPIVTG
jgi:glucose-6-phosphate 1-dehydrogenase